MHIDAAFCLAQVLGFSDIPLFFFEVISYSLYRIIIYRDDRHKKNPDRSRNQIPYNMVSSEVLGII